METLVVMLIFSMVAGSLYATVAVGETSWQVNKTKIEVYQELRKAMDWMKYELQQAGDSSIVDVPADGVTCPCTVITFKIPDPVSPIVAGDINWSANTIQFALGGADETDLQRTEAGVTRTLATNIQSLTFTRQVASSNILEVSVQAQKDTVKGIPLTSQLDFEVQLRN